MLLDHYSLIHIQSFQMQQRGRKRGEKEKKKEKKEKKEGKIRKFQSAHRTTKVLLQG